MAVKILQINLNHSKVAQDLAVQRAMEDGANVILVSEPYKISAHDCWFFDENGLAAIYRNPLICKESARLIDRKPRFVAVKVGITCFYSCYISPNRSIEDFDLFLQALSDSIHLHGKVSTVISEDFNAKHGAWGSRVEDSRGRILTDWISQHGLAILNEGVTPTFSRETGESVIDLTFCTGDLARLVSNWRVNENIKTLSDHRYISMVISGLGWARLGKPNQMQRYPR